MSTLTIHWKDWCRSWSSNTLATWWEELTHLKRPWCWERLKVGGEGDDRGWDGWMTSLTWWIWVWVSSGSWWWAGKAGVLPWGRKESDTTEWLNWLTSDYYTEDHRMGNMYIIAGGSIAGYSSRKYLLSYYWLQTRGSEKLEVTIAFR